MSRDKTGKGCFSERRMPMNKFDEIYAKARVFIYRNARPLELARWRYHVENWDRDPVYMISAWMSQDYLNIRARLPYDTKERLLAVMVDESSLDNEYPDCYLIHRLEEPVNTFERNYYTSFDMSALRKLPACKGFNLILNNSNLQRDTYKFELD